MEPFSVYYQQFEPFAQPLTQHAQITSAAATLPTTFQQYPIQQHQFEPIPQTIYNAIPAFTDQLWEQQYQQFAPAVLQPSVPHTISTSLPPPTYQLGSQLPIPTRQQPAPQYTQSIPTTVPTSTYQTFVSLTNLLPSPPTPSLSSSGEVKLEEREKKRSQDKKRRVDLTKVFKRKFQALLKTDKKAKVS